MRQAEEAIQRAEQATQAVESAFGPVPGSQLPHVVRASFTTAGELQAVHTPMTEYVAPAQGSHAEMSAFGCVPAAQAWHTAWSALATMLLPTAVLLGLLHVSHTAVPLLAVPAVQLVQVVPPSSACCPAAQLTHTVAALRSVSAWPRGHAAHCVPPMNE